MDDDTPDPDLLLHGSETGVDSNALLLGVLAAAGVGLIYLSKKKKEEKKEGKTGKKESSKGLPEAEANQVVFNADASAYEAGTSWLTMTLDPYLEEKVEEIILATPEWKTKGPLGWVMTGEALEKAMSDTRKKVLSTFAILTFVKVGKGQKTIAALPDTEAVRNFWNVIRAHTKKFQEEY